MNRLKENETSTVFRFPVSALGSLLVRYDSIVFIDTETTGFHAETDHITEFAAIKIKRDGTEERFDTFIKLPDGFSIPENLVAITGITDEMCKTGIDGEELLGLLLSLLDNRSLIVAYNTQFDASFLLALALKNGKEAALLPSENLDYLDALTVYRDRAEAPHKLSDAIGHYGINGKNSHRAIEDAEALMEVTKAMASEKDDLLSYVNRFGYKAKYGVSGIKIAGISYYEQLE